ncbi:MAG: YihY/virulence factor BrkB family protein, partial [Prevotella sp.]|nr:YihY/virulence factor BrkB family protein [Prevotella sp.]
MSIEQIKEFFSEKIWQISKDELSLFQYVVVSILKRIILAIKFFIDKDVISTASALTYSTLLAIVPVIAVLYAIANGFGFSKYIEEWLLSALSSQPQAANVIIGFVHSYISHTHSGVILGIGLLFMLWTVLMLIHNIETAFNQIWQVEEQRTWIRKVTDYLAMFFLAPIIIVLQSGISIFLATIAKEMEEYMLLGPMVRMFIGFMPYVITSVVFVVLYMFMPNTRVKFKDAVIPGILAGVAMQMLQFFYIHCQVFLSGYNAIYGSFAALPLFMLWV